MGGKKFRIDFSVNGLVQFEISMNGVEYKRISVVDIDEESCVHLIAEFVGNLYELGFEREW